MIFLACIFPIVALIPLDHVFQFDLIYFQEDCRSKTVPFLYLNSCHYVLQPEVDVVVNVNEPLLSEDHLKDANLLSLTVESVYSPPEAWANQPAAYVYTAALPLPQNAEVTELSPCFSYAIHTCCITTVCG